MRLAREMDAKGELRRAARRGAHALTVSTVAACTSPATGERPPDRMLAAVRASAPVAGRPPTDADAMLATPCAMSSVSGSCLSPTMPSATTQHSNDSMAANTAMVKAGGRSEPTVSRVGRDRWGRGSDVGIAPAPKRDPIVWMPCERKRV